MLIPVTRADLEAWEKRSLASAGPGDVVLLYIGRWKRPGTVGPRQYEFLVTFAPLPVEGGTGSPVNPLAISGFLPGHERATAAC